jgi:Na+/glutamate symporter
MRKSLDLIIQKATWKKAVIFSLIFVFFYILINPSGIGVAGLLKITGGANILDFEFGYTHEGAYKILTELGEKGREFYLTRIVPLDFPFPLSYMLFYAVWTALLLKHTALKKWCKYTILFSFFAMLFDWIENIGIIIMLTHYPDLPAWAV